MLSPSFKYQSFDGFLANFNHHSRILTQLLARDQKGNGMGKSVNKYLYGATMDFITEAAFGQQSNYQVDVDIGFFEHVQM